MAEISPALQAAARSLAPSGTLRVAINFGNRVLVQPDAAGGPPGGVSGELARELAQRLGLDLHYVPFEGAGAVSEAARQGGWDVCFLAIDPHRAEIIDFTAPYVLIEGGYLVAEASLLRSCEEVDQPGVRVIADHGAAYELFLRRTLKHAQLVYPPAGQRSLDHYFAAPATAALAYIRQPLEVLAASHPGYRVLPGRFMEIRQAMGTLPGRDVGFAFLQSFVEEMKASGFVARCLAASGQSEARVAPPAA